MISGNKSVDLKRVFCDVHGTVLGVQYVYLLWPAGISMSIYPKATIPEYIRPIIYHRKNEISFFFFWISGKSPTGLFFLGLKICS
jgi:hypothetical protein